MDWRDSLDRANDISSALSSAAEEIFDGRETHEEIKRLVDDALSSFNTLVKESGFTPQCGNRTTLPEFLGYGFEDLFEPTTELVVDLPVTRREFAAEWDIQLPDEDNLVRRHPAHFLYVEYPWVHGNGVKVVEHCIRLLEDDKSSLELPQQIIFRDVKPLFRRHPSSPAYLPSLLTNLRLTVEQYENLVRPALQELLVADEAINKARHADRVLFSEVDAVVESVTTTKQLIARYPELRSTVEDWVRKNHPEKVVSAAKPKQAVFNTPPMLTPALSAAFAAKGGN
jgi:hypothetical protein